MNTLDIFEQILTERVRPLHAHMSDFHGMSHITQVTKYARDIACHMSNDTKFIESCMLAGALHDCGRKNDDWDTAHAVDGLPIARKFLTEFYPEYDIPEILLAISVHPIAHGTYPNHIAECLCDADRIRLAHYYGYTPEYFATCRGRTLAQTQEQ